MKKICLLLFAVTMVLVCSMQAQAALQNLGTDSLGNRLIYDTDFDITWYDYTNSLNTWQDQMAWADALTVDFGGSIIDDWRLPVTFSLDCWSNCTNSEMGHIYYTELALENTAYGETLINASYFQNLQSVIYWSGTEHFHAGQAWVFDYSNGNQAPLPKVESHVCGGIGATDCYSGLAVRSGLAVVPEPISSILFVTGGTLLAGRRYIKRRKKA